MYRNDRIWLVSDRRRAAHQCSRPVIEHLVMRQQPFDQPTGHSPITTWSPGAVAATLARLVHLSHYACERRTEVFVTGSDIGPRTNTGPANL